jgi:hypothetical protein
MSSESLRPLILLTYLPGLLSVRGWFGIAGRVLPVHPSQGIFPPVLFKIFTFLLKPLAQLAKPQELFGRQNPPDKEFVHKAKFYNFGLCQLKFSQTGRDIGFNDLIGIYDLIQGSIGLAKPLLCFIHQRLSGRIYPADLLNLFR